MYLAKSAKTLGFSLRKPNVVVCTPFSSTSVDRRAIIDAVKNAGAKKVALIEEPVAAAIGAGMPIDEPVANVIVDIGGGSTEVAIISFGGVVACHSIKIGGDHWMMILFNMFERNITCLLVNEQLKTSKWKLVMA